MNPHQTTMEDNFYLQMMGICTFSQEMVEWQETHLGNTGMPRTSNTCNTKTIEEFVTLYKVNFV